MAEELLEKVPLEKRWEITARALIKLTLLRGGKSVAPLLGRGEGFIAPVMAVDKFLEINHKIYAESGKKLYPLITEMFNVPVENAIDACKLQYVAANLLSGPGYEIEIIEVLPERVVWRVTNCPWWDVYEEIGVAPEFRACDLGCPGFNIEGLAEVNTKITFTSTKSMPKGDSYCERIIEFKEE